MKNGIYIENYGAHKKCTVCYKDNEIYCVEYNDGVKNWLNQKGQYNRLDGPAIEFPNGYNYWYLDGKIIYVKSQKEFEEYLRLEELRAFE